jgi:hypothetical protein
MSITSKENNVKKNNVARCQWRTPIILATQEAVIRRIEVQRSGQMVCKTLSQKTIILAQGVGPEFKPQHHKKIRV